MRDSKTKQAFIKYLKDPKTKDLRFWQALRNWSEFDQIDGWKGDESVTDTFYIEEI